MEDGKAQKEGAPRDRSPELGIAAWGLGLWATTRVIAAVVSTSATAALVGQAVLVEWGTSRLGVRWTEGREESGGKLARRGLIGAAIGTAIACILLVVSAATGGATTAPNNRPIEISVLGIGLVTAALIAMKEELLLHGLVLRIAPPNAARFELRALACGLASAGAALGETGATAAGTVTHFLFGTLLGSLWVRDRGAWVAWGTHTGLVFATGTLFHGIVRDVAPAGNAWGGKAPDLLDGWAGAVTLLPLVAAALVVKRPVSSPSSRSVG